MKADSPQPTREQKFRILLLNAMTRPLAAAVLAITIVIGLLVSYWFLLVGLIFYAVIVYSTLQDARESQAVLNEVLYPERVRKLDPRRLSGGYRAALERAMETRRKIEKAVADTGNAGVRRALADSTDDMEELVGTIYDIAIKAQTLQQSLQASNLSVTSLNRDIEKLSELVETTGDEVAQRHYRATLEGKQQQLQNYTDTNEALNRWHAQLDNALSTLDTILSQVLRIRSSEVLSLSHATDEVEHSLRDEVEALKATSDALDVVFGLRK